MEISQPLQETKISLTLAIDNTVFNILSNILPIMSIKSESKILIIIAGHMKPD